MHKAVMRHMQPSKGDRGEPELYEIRIEGHLDDRWADRFEGLTLTREANGETLLTGPVVDQPALHGLLRKVRDLGLTFTSLKRIVPGSTDAADAWLDARPTRSKKGHEDMTTPRVESSRKIALAAGVLFVITSITPIPPALYLHVPVLDAPRYIFGAGADNGVSLGAFLELLLIVANIGTAVVLFPILKRVNEIFALGYVTARVVECAFIAVGILSLLTVVTLRQEAAGADVGSLVAVGRSLVALHGWTFLLGPGFVVGIGNGLLLGYLMYKSALVPRRMAMLGLIAGPVLLARFVGILFGVFEPGSVVGSFMVAPEFVWEASLGIWLIVKGFNPSALAPKATSTLAPEYSRTAIRGV